MNVLDAIGNAMIQGLAYVGGLTMQFLSELRDSPRVLPLMGRRGRWRTAMQQMERSESMDCRLSHLSVVAEIGPTQIGERQEVRVMEWLAWVTREIGH